MAKTTRHTAKTYRIPADLVSLINWNALGEQRRQLNSDMDVRRLPDGSLTVTLVWVDAKEQS